MNLLSPAEAIVRDIGAAAGLVGGEYRIYLE